MGLVTLFIKKFHSFFTEILLRVAHLALLLRAATTCLAIHAGTGDVTLGMRERACRIVTVLLGCCVTTLRRLLYLLDLLHHYGCGSRLRKHYLLKCWKCIRSRCSTCNHLKLCKECVPLEGSHMQ